MPRRALDFYETPPHYVDALIDVIGIKLSYVYDPCCGQRAILRQLRARGCSALFRTNDIDPTMPARTHHDATENSDAWGTLGIDWCITNPPFNQELPILEQALQFHRNVAFLARLSFLEPTVDRRPFWKRYADRCRLIVLPRYSFRLNDKGKRQTDSVTCCWLVWTISDKPYLSVA